MRSNSARGMNLQPSPPDKTMPTTAEAMQQLVSADKSGCIFYKLILQSIIHEKELGIPKKFGQKFGDKLSDVVTLVDCNLAKWKIGLRRLNHKLWFHHGWPKFVEDHSIHAGSFLIFKYEENSNFTVYIYNLAASEMKASLDSAGPSSEPAQPEKIEVASVRSPQSKDIYRTVMLPPASKTPKDKPFVKCCAEKTSSAVADSIVREKPAPKTGTRVDVDELTETQPNSKWKRRLISELDGCHNKKKPRMEVHDKKASFLKWKRRSGEVTDEERRRVVLAAENFKSEFPFCRIIMRASYVYYRFDLKLPSEFSKKYLKDTQGVIELQDPNGRKWQVRCCNKGDKARVSTGWRDFVLENNLDDGDVCIFELVQRDDIVLKVSIFRASKPEEVVQVSSVSVPKSTPSVVVDNIPLERREQEVASIRSPQSKDIYRTVMLPSPSKTPTNKPFDEFGAEKTSSVVADSNVKPDLERRDKPAAGIGTRVDADELIETQPNSKWKRRLISEQDGCCNKKKPRMEVHDKKASFLWKRRSGEVTDEERRRVVLAAENFKSDFPFCRIMMRVSYVYYNFDLCVPSEFSKKHLKDIQGVIELQDPNGRKWPVQCSYKDNRGRAQLTTGWRGFVVENNLDDGDVCIFELVQRDYIVLKVSIFRASNPEAVQASSESMPKSTPSMVVDNIPLERREQEVNTAQHSGIGIEDYANDFKEKLNEDIEIIVTQNLQPGCSKDNNVFVECMAKKTSSNIADSIGCLPFEMRDKPAHEIGIKVNADHPMEAQKEFNNIYLANQPKLPNSIWKRRLISELGDCCNKKKVKTEARNKASSLRWKRRPRTVTDGEKRQAVHAAAHFTSEFPFCRMVMQPSYVYSNFRLFLPADFSKKYLLGIRGQITLQNSNGRKWSARCRFKKSIAIITTGWREFVVDNNLNGGDVCIFELVQVEEDTVVLKVSFFRAATIPEDEIVQLYGESVPQKIEGSEQEVNPAERVDIEDYANDFMEKSDEDVYAKTGIRADAQQEANNFNTGPSSEPARAEQIEVASIRSPQFKDIYQNLMLPLPSKTPKDKPFAELSAEKTPSVTADSIVKPVLEMRDEPAPKIGVTVDADELMETQPNSKCKRMLISELDDCRDKNKPRMEVHDKKASFFKWNRRPRGATYEERRHAVLAAENFKSDLSFCRIMILMSDVFDRFELCLPAEFSSKHMKDIQEIIKLQDPNGRKWPVWCSYKNDRAKLTIGWHDFVAENNLDDGDVCIFELVQRDDIVLKVSIFRAANPEELVQESSESMLEDVSALVVDDITLQGREEEVKFAQHIGTEDYANDIVEKLNEDIDIFVPQNLAGCSKDNNGFAECMEEKTSSNIADNVGWLPFEMRNNPVREMGIKFNADHLMETRKDINNLYLANQPKSISELDDCCNKKNMKMEARNKVPSFKWKRRPKTLTHEEKRQAVHVAANFTSQFPFCRMVMQPSYVYSKCGLFFPAGFSKKYLPDIRGPVTLQDSNGRKWPAQFRYKKYNAIITTGWREFVVDNNLYDGDVCIFELVQREEDIVVLKVSIFRAAAIPQEEIVQVSGESMHENAFAMVVDDIPLEGREEEVNFSQHLDSEDYANGFMEKLNDDIDIVVPHLAPGCSKGINAFVECMAEKTSSNIADTIDWPPLETRDRPVQGTGIRVNADHLMETRKEINNLYLANQPRSCNKKKVKKKEARDKASSWKRRPRTVTDEEKRQAVHAAANFTSEFPFCRMVMQPSYVYSNFNLYLPACFSKKYLLGIRGPMTLQDSNGKKWPARCSYRYRKSSAVITTGWRKFVVDNNLDGGDVCTFELLQMEGDIVVLKVSTFRAATNPREERVQVYGESVPQKIEGSEQEVNLAQCVDVEDYANDFMEKANEDAYAEMGTRGDAQQEANNFDLTDQPKLPDSDWKRTLTSELDECRNKKEVRMEVRNKASSLKWKRSRAVTDEEKRLAVHAAANFKSKFPFCRMVMWPSYVYYNYVLYPPAGFSQKHLKDIRVITLRDPNGREWLARCSNYRDTVKIRKGWREFVVDNNLDDGDVCIFELVRKEDDTVVLKVSIFRAAKPQEVVE